MKRASFNLLPRLCCDLNFLMSMAVLRSQDCFKGVYHLDAFSSRPQTDPRPPRKNHHRPSWAASPSQPKARQVRQPRSSPPPPPPPTPHQARLAHAASSNRARPSRKSLSPTKNITEEQTKRALVMEEVRILKRGEDMKPSAGLALCDSVQAALSSTGPPYSEPEIVPTKTDTADVDSIYAGPAFFFSPSPSSLPMPGFSLKKMSVTPFNCDEGKKILLMALGLNHLP